MQNSFLKLNANDQQPLSKIFKEFDPISLEDTNNSAQMLKRFDNKYVVSKEEFEKFIRVLHDDFVILEIKGIREFSYRSCYFDDKNYRCYIDHLQGKRHRFKVRTREYVDSGLIFFEVKLKGLRGKTDKHRIRSEQFSTPNIEGEELTLLTESFENRYKTKFAYDLKPTLIVNYRRCTLVARKGGERVTIDFALSFSPFNQRDDSIQIGDDFIIIETKSGDGRGLADKVMKTNGIRLASKCSKYCLGLNLARLVNRNNYFLPMIRLISKNIISGKQLFKPSSLPPLKIQHQNIGWAK